MVNILAALVLFALVVLLVVAGLRLRRRQLSARQSPAFDRRRHDDLRARLLALVPRLPERAALLAEDLPPHPAAATIEAHLLRNEPKQALAAAEAAVAETPKDGAGHAILARALLACDALVPAEGEIRKARELGGAGPLLDHVEGRVEHLLWLRRVNPGRPEVQQQLVPPLLTPFDRFLVQMARRGQSGEAEGAFWLAKEGGGGNQGARLDAEQLQLMIARHQEAGLRSLELLLRAAEKAPGAGELVYHLARRAVQTGFVAEGRALFAKVPALLADTADLALCERDLAELAGRGDEELAPPRPPSTPPGAKRSSALKILS